MGRGVKQQRSGVILPNPMTFSIDQVEILADLVEIPSNLADLTRVFIVLRLD